MSPVVVALTAALIAFSTAAAAAAPRLLWETKGLAQPESVVEDPATGVIYVSNINGAVMQKEGNGFISRLTAIGKMLERQWVKGLNSPTGLALHDRTLYAADVDKLIEINAASGEILKRYDAKGAVFLNDVVVDDEGTVYVSDTPMNTIWRLKEGSFEPWLANTLIVASLGKVQSQGQKKELGTLLAVSLDDQKMSKVGKGELIGNLDGLQAIQPGVYLVTDWAQGALYRVDAKGKVDELIDLNQGSADLSYLPSKKMLLIPMMLDNSLVAYRLD
jgi:sugar lactone lactonase YvrE